MTVVLAGRLLAEPVPSVDLRNFRPPTHPESLLTLEPTATPAQGEWNLGAWTSYAYRPVVVDDAFRGDGIPLIEHQLSLDLVGSIAVAERIAIGASLPAVLAQ
ncbi:MAG TPA: hypothetical protein VMS65_10390, partial [Polyangiaceae bacterium]|nr:hypothetical protein [Polyangiaceae bacterium]